MYVSYCQIKLCIQAIVIPCKLYEFLALLRLKTPGERHYWQAMLTGQLAHWDMPTTLSHFDSLSQTHGQMGTQSLRII